MGRGRRWGGRVAGADALRVGAGGDAGHCRLAVWACGQLALLSGLRPATDDLSLEAVGNSSLCFCSLPLQME